MPFGCCIGISRKTDHDVLRWLDLDTDIPHHSQLGILDVMPDKAGHYGVS